MKYEYFNLPPLDGGSWHSLGRVYSSGGIPLKYHQLTCLALSATQVTAAERTARIRTVKINHNINIDI